MRTTIILSALLLAGCATEDAAFLEKMALESSEWEKIQGKDVFAVEINFENRGLVSFTAHSRKDCPHLTLEMDRYDDEKTPYEVIKCKIVGRAYLDAEGFRHVIAPKWCFMCASSFPTP